MADKRLKRRTKEGIVVSNKMEKTVVVEVERTFRHPLYDKVIRRVKRIKAHDEEKACMVGDRVLIMETRPISKDKHFRVVEVLGHKKGKIEIAEPEWKATVHRPEFQLKQKVDAESAISETGDAT